VHGATEFVRPHPQEMHNRRGVLPGGELDRMRRIDYDTGVYLPGQISAGYTHDDSDRHVLMGMRLLH
jgi:hypothetical protein